MEHVGTVLQVTDLVRRFGEHTAVDGVSFTISEGETYGLLGPNGAGKTTTINMIAGLLTSDQGAVTVLGEPVVGNRKSLIGLVPQDVALYPDLSALENLQFFGKLQNMGGTHLKNRIADVLEIVGLADRAKDHIDTYSGGMKRRANIAVGLLHEPRLLILDEPTVGVDPQSRNSILEAVTELGGAGMAVLYTTHYMEEAERLCDRVGIIDAGRLIVEGTREELVARMGEQSTIDLRVSADHDRVGRWCADVEKLADVAGIQRTAGGVQVVTAGGTALIAPVVQAAQRNGVDVTGIDVREPDLEAVFLHLTGKALRD